MLDMGMCERELACHFQMKRQLWIIFTLHGLKSVFMYFADNRRVSRNTMCRVADFLTGLQSQTEQRRSRMGAGIMSSEDNLRI